MANLRKDNFSDKLILESYKNLVDALACYLGEAFEIVLHSLVDLDHSVIKIANGFHSGRKEGAPITDFALSMLEKIRGADGEKGYAAYFSASKYGKPVKSTTTVIFGEGGSAIGLLCVNLYFDSPISTILQNFSSDAQSEFIAESFITDSKELIQRTLERVKDEVLNDKSIMPSQKNKTIITRLYKQGIFRLKNSVPRTARELCISKNTVYMHIRTLDSLSGVKSI